MIEAATAPQSRRFSLVQLVLIVPWVAAVIGAWGPITDNSFLWHIRAGTLQSEAVEVLTADPFSFTMNGAPWRTQSWLVELLYDWSERVSGLGFVPWMILVVTTLTLCSVGLIAYRRSASVTGTASILLMTTLVMITFSVPRPVIFSYLLFALVILAWDQPRYRWAVPFLFWLWASSHGSFVIGLAYVGLALIMEREWHWIPAALSGGLATLITAHGLGVVEILLGFGAARDALPFLTEWRKPTLDTVAFIPFVGGAALVVIGAAQQVIRPRHVWLIAPFLLLGMSSLRSVPPAWLGLVPLVALSVSGVTIASKGRFGTSSATAFALFVFLLPFFLIERSEIAEDRFPVIAATALGDVPTFHDDRVGGYLVWAQGPDRLVYLDDRAELYLDRLEEFSSVRSRQTDWRTVFERDGIEQALLENGELLIGDLQSAGWLPTYSDDNFTIMRP